MTFLSVKPQAGRVAYPRFTNWFDTFVENEFPHTKEGAHTPALVNTKETKENYRIEVAAPGYSKDNFKLLVEEQTLTIGADATETKADENEKWTRKEYHFAGFKRSFTLPKTVDAEKITAEYKDGILYVTLPKIEEGKQKSAIDIKIS